MMKFSLVDWLASEAMLFSTNSARKNPRWCRVHKILAVQHKFLVLQSARNPLWCWVHEILVGVSREQTRVDAQLNSNYSATTLPIIPRTQAQTRRWWSPPNISTQMWPVLCCAHSATNSSTNPVLGMFCFCSCIKIQIQTYNKMLRYKLTLKETTN